MPPFYLRLLLINQTSDGFNGPPSVSSPNWGGPPTTFGYPPGSLNGAPGTLSGPPPIIGPGGPR